MISSSLIPAPSSAPTMRPSFMTIDPVAHADDLLQLGGDEDAGDALARQIVDEPVYLVLRRDVDASRRLVDDEDPRARYRCSWPGRPSAGFRRYRFSSLCPAMGALISNVPDVAAASPAPSRLFTAENGLAVARERHQGDVLRPR